MRDTHGRYASLKDIAANGPSWAKGCAHCTGGVMSAPDLTGAAPLYMERMVQHLDKSLTLCDCRAGRAYYASLGNRYRKLVEEARQDKRMTEWAARRSHPDIEAARLAVHAAYELAKPPTIHYEETPSEAVHA